MAKSEYAGLCLFVLLTIAAQCGHGSETLQAEIGSIHIFNGANYDIFIASRFELSNGGGYYGTGLSPLKKGTSFNFPVEEGRDCVTTE